MGNPTHPRASGSKQMDMNWKRGFRIIVTAPAKPCQVILLGLSGPLGERNLPRAPSLAAQLITGGFIFLSTGWSDHRGDAGVPPTPSPGDHCTPSRRTSMHRVARYQSLLESTARKVCGREETKQPRPQEDRSCFGSSAGRRAPDRRPNAITGCERVNLAQLEKL
jgi:hypothetical protein